MAKKQDKDSSFELIPAPEPGKIRPAISFEIIKTTFIAEGLSAEDIAKRYFLPTEAIERIIVDHKLVELRKAYIREGVAKIQNVQLHQAQKILDIEVEFKKLRLVQLEDRLNDFMAYYACHGDLYKRHPVSGDVLKDTDGIRMQLNVPNVAREIQQLKESVTLSEGIKKLMSDLDSIINGKQEAENADNDGEVIDLDAVDSFFKKKV